MPKSTLATTIASTDDFFQTHDFKFYERISAVLHSTKITPDMVKPPVFAELTYDIKTKGYDPDTSFFAKKSLKRQFARAIKNPRLFQTQVFPRVRLMLNRTLDPSPGTIHELYGEIKAQGWGAFELKEEHDTMFLFRDTKSDSVIQFSRQDIDDAVFLRSQEKHAPVDARLLRKGKQAFFTSPDFESNTFSAYDTTLSNTLQDLVIGSSRVLTGYTPSLRVDSKTLQPYEWEEDFHQKSSYSHEFFLRLHRAMNLALPVALRKSSKTLDEAIEETETLVASAISRRDKATPLTNTLHQLAIFTLGYLDFVNKTPPREMYGYFPSGEHDPVFLKTCEEVYETGFSAAMDNHLNPNALRRAFPTTPYNMRTWNFLDELRVKNM